MHLIIRPEQPDDLAAIRAVHQRPSLKTAKENSWKRPRDGFTRLSLVAVEGGSVVGHIVFSDLHIVGQQDTVPGLALAPLAVLPSHQRQGIGSALIREGLRICGPRPPDRSGRRPP